MNPDLIYARAKGFGVEGPLAGRPSFDYVVQAATGMEMTQGGSAGPRPGNVVVNDYGTGLLLAAGVVCALLGRARGVAVTTVDASLAMTASLYQAGDVATLAVHGELGDRVGDEARGPVGRAAPVPHQGRLGHRVLRHRRPRWLSSERQPLRQVRR